MHETVDLAKQGAMGGRTGVPAKGAQWAGALLLGLLLAAPGSARADQPYAFDGGRTPNEHCESGVCRPPTSPLPVQQVRSPENTSEACRDHLDDDADGYIDCADLDCGDFVFCARPQDVRPAPPAASVAGAIGNPATDGAASAPTKKGKTHGIVGLIVTGSLTLGLSYAAMVTTTAIVSEGHAASTGLASVPLAGPFLLLAVEPGSQPYAPAIVTVGALEHVGLLLTIIGVSVRRPDAPSRRGVSAPSWPEIGTVGDAGLSLKWKL